MYLTAIPQGAGFMNIPLNEEMTLSIDIDVDRYSDWCFSHLIFKNGGFLPLGVCFKRDELFWSDKWETQRNPFVSYQLKEEDVRPIAHEVLKLIYQKAPAKVYFEGWSILDLLASGTRYKELVYYEDENGELQTHISYNEQKRRFDDNWNDTF